MLTISFSWPIEGVDIPSPVAHCILIISAEKRKTRDVNSTLAVDAITTSVSYDGVGFSKEPAVNERRKHGADDSGVAVCDP